MLESISLIRSDAATYDECHRVLGLPADVHWSDIDVRFGSDDIGQVTLTLVCSGEQIAELARLAVMATANANACVPDTPHLPA